MNEKEPPDTLLFEGKLQIETAYDAIKELDGYEEAKIAFRTVLRVAASRPPHEEEEYLSLKVANQDELAYAMIERLSVIALDQSRPPEATIAAEVLLELLARQVGME